MKAPKTHPDSCRHHGHTRTGALAGAMLAGSTRLQIQRQAIAAAFGVVAQPKRYAQIARTLDLRVIGPLSAEPAEQATNVLVAIRTGDHGLLGDWFGDLGYYDAEDWGAFAGALDVAGQVWVRGYLAQACTPGFIARLVAVGLPVALRPAATSAEEDTSLQAKLTGKGVDAQVAAAALQAAIQADAQAGSAARVALAATICLIYKRVGSILAKGVMLPSELRGQQVDHTPSSDRNAEDKASFFDIDYTRNQPSEERPDPYEERFKFPGHQSINPVLERQNDIERIARMTVNAAKRVPPNATALASVQALKDQEHDTGTVTAFIAKIETTAALFVRLGTIARTNDAGLRELEARARSSAMVISAGAKREGSRLVKQGWTKKDGYGPMVAEMRAPVGLEPEAISHVLLPSFMRNFEPVRWWGKEVRFVGEVVTRVGYYDEASRVKQELNLNVPNYQAAIEEIAKEVDGKMITHITNV